MKILITGASGFIGSELCKRLAVANSVVGVDVAPRPEKLSGISWESLDLNQEKAIAVLSDKYSPDVVIHCAGIAHQTIGFIDRNTYMKMNSIVAEKVAKAVTLRNPNVRFIFLSSVSVYGESKDEAVATGEKSSQGINEQTACRPSSDYALSKLDAEERLSVLYHKGIIKDLVILRLAPVYDREWSLNLDRRIFTPGKLAYLRFGSGSQMMSALARPNLVDFINYILRSKDYVNENNLCINVCDTLPYTFNTIIRVFRESGVFAKRFIISAPLSLVWFATRVAGVLFFHKRQWIYSCYDKLACDLVFDNTRMMRTGFKPEHSLETVFFR